MPCRFKARQGTNSLLPNPETGYPLSSTLFLSYRRSLDGQYVVNPAYNKDRAPAKLVGVRFHVEL